MKLLRAAGVLALFILSPLLLLISAVALVAVDAAFALFGRKHPAAVIPPRHECATVVIPNWNGRDLLDRYLPSVIAAVSGHPENEIIVVDNASTDGSAEFLDREFPQV